MSDFLCEVVPIKLEKHPNADSLSLVNVNGWQVVVRTSDWVGVDKGVYILPDSVVPDTEEWAWLDGKRRIGARRFRGEWSYGLLAKIPPSLEHSVQLGDNLAEFMNIIHYEPKIIAKRNSQGRSDEEISKPKDKGPYYDIQNYNRYNRVIAEGEEVVITEKLHGCSARFTYQNGEFHVASRRFYRKEFWYKNPPKNLLRRGWQWFKEVAFGIKREVWMNDSFYWQALKSNPQLMRLCKDHPNVIFYGEIYGKVQAGFPYDSTDDEPYKVLLFDACNKVGNEYVFWGWEDFKEVVPPHMRVPVDYVGPFDVATLRTLAEAGSWLTKNHIREGCVIKPVVERRSPSLGRVILKLVNPKYLESEH